MRAARRLLGRKPHGDHDEAAHENVYQFVPADDVDESILQRDKNGYVSFTPVGIKTKKKNRRLVAALPEQPQGSLTEVPVKVPDPRTIAQLKWTKANEITVKYGEDDDHEVVIGHLRSVAEEV
jgi:hypothetical protein